MPLEGAAREALAGATGPRRVLVVYHRDGVSSAPLGPGAGVVVGRDAPSDLVIRDASLSRRHARFRVEAGEVVVVDLARRTAPWSPASAWSARRWRPATR